MPPYMSVLALILGLAAGYYVRYLQALSKKNSIEIVAKEKLLETEKKAIGLVEKAEEKITKLEEEARLERKSQEEKLSEKETYLQRREESYDQRQIELDSQREHLQNKVEEIKAIKAKLDEHAHSLDAKLEEIAGYTSDEALNIITTKLEKERAEDLRAYIEKLDRLGNEQIERRAGEILLSTIHRLGNSLSPSVTTSHIEIPSDDVKGKIIGKEGRNVRAFERLTGVDVLVDETPGYIVLSCFDPIRREIASVALENLLKDGRIQPARIEEVVEQAKHEVAGVIKKMGEKAAYEANVPNLHPDLVNILGRLHFRTSYGQNVLWHSVEMAHLAGMLAEELKADVAVARAGALLHDIGKAVSHEVAGTHVEIGIRILEKFGVDQKVILAMRAHHEEYPYETPESVIVQIADAVSGGRPGARRDSIENYIKRLTELETIARTITGVDKAFAISAGREVRVLVNPEELNDFETQVLARTIATTIENKLRYPGEIKVHVIRETRVISYAR